MALRFRMLPGVLVAGLLAAMCPRPALAQYVAGDTLVLTFEKNDRIPIYTANDADETDFNGYWLRAEREGDTLFYVRPVGDRYHLVNGGGEHVVVGSSALMANTLNPKQIREARQEAEAAAARERERQRRAEEEAAEVRLWMSGLRDAGVPVIVSRLDFHVNSAGGVEPTIAVTNISDKRIKYVTVAVVGVNAVGDVVRSEIGGSTTHTMRLVGPIEPSERSLFSYEDDPVFYNRVTSCIEIRRVGVEFTDGSTYTMINDLKRARQRETDYNLNGECSQNR